MMSYDIDEYILSLDLVNYPEEEMRKVLNENMNLRATIIQLSKDALPDPYDERDVSLSWLRARIHAARAALEQER